VVQHVDAAADPADFDPVDPIVLAEAEVQARAPMALVSPSAVDFVDPSLPDELQDLPASGI